MLPGSANTGTINVMQQAIAQNIPFIAVTAGNQSILGGLNLSANAKAYIRGEVLNGLIVLVPAQEVVIGNATTVSWFELNPVSGELAGVLESGIRSASAATEYSTVLSSSQKNILIAFGAGAIAGIIGASIEILVGKLLAGQLGSGGSNGGGSNGGGSNGGGSNGGGSNGGGSNGGGSNGGGPGGSSGGGLTPPLLKRLAAGALLAVGVTLDVQLGHGIGDPALWAAAGFSLLADVEPPLFPILFGTQVPYPSVPLDRQSSTLAANATTAPVFLNDNPTNVLTVSATPNTLTTDQNTPVTFQRQRQHQPRRHLQPHRQGAAGLDRDHRQQRQRHRDARAGTPERHLSDPDHRPIARPTPTWWRKPPST